MAPISSPRSIHSASLVDPALHSPEIEELLKTELSRPFIGMSVGRIVQHSLVQVRLLTSCDARAEYIVERVIDVVDYALGRPSTSAQHGRSQAPLETCRAVHTDFSTFARRSIERAGVQIPVLLGTLVYLDRAKPHLQLSLEEWACERVFLGALICANKVRLGAVTGTLHAISDGNQKYAQYLNDSTLKNVHWSLVTGLFNKRDVGRIEREFLDVLDFELRVTEEEILDHYEPLMLLQKPHAPPRLRIPSASSISTPASTARSAWPSLSRHSSSSSSSSAMDVDEDSPTSSSSGSLPSTPSSFEQDTAVYVRTLSKHSPEHDDVDSPHRVRYASVSSSESVQKAKDAAGSLSHGHHPRLSSAFNMLRSIHKPHFHHSCAS
jgi:hypothetical protein